MALALRRKKAGGASQPPPFRQASKWIDERLGLSKFAPKQLSKVFPDHWSFMLGEVTLYCFVILLATGVYLTFFFEPSVREVTYNGSYAPLVGTQMSAAYKSAVDLSFDVRAGLVMRQMHHWSALLFVAAMVLHLLRVFFTGAYRKPRELNWVIGVNLLILAVINGFLGYSLLDDLLSGTGVRVGYSILLSIPLIGDLAASLVFGGPFPSPAMIPRFFALHVLLLPAAIIGLLSAHLGMVWFQKHTQFRGPDRTEHNVVGTPLFPTYAVKALGLFVLVVAVVAAMSGLAQINPIWKFGPFAEAKTVAAVTSASQPDWYMGWMDGLLRLIPGWETRVAGFMIPNAFWGGIVLPGITFTVMMLWPWLEPRWTKDRKAHNLLDRPRDAPFRAGFGAGVLMFYFLLLLAGSNDVLATIFSVSPENITYVFRVLIFVGPVVTYLVTKRICEDLQGTNAHPAAPGPNHLVIRRADGGYDIAHGVHHDDPHDLVVDPNNTNAPAPGEPIDKGPTSKRKPKPKPKPKPKKEVQN